MKKLYLGLTLIVVGFLFLGLARSIDKRQDQRRSAVIYNAVKIVQEWAYFEGQKEAINGDVRIKYDEQSKKYSWIKSCWDDGMKPTFDPSQSEDMKVFLTKTNLVK